MTSLESILAICVWALLIHDEAADAPGVLFGERGSRFWVKFAT